MCVSVKELSCFPFHGRTVRESGMNADWKVSSSF